MNQINVQVLHVEQVYEHCLCTLQVQLRDYMCVQKIQNNKIYRSGYMYCSIRVVHCTCSIGTRVPGMITVPGIYNRSPIPFRHVAIIAFVKLVLLQKRNALRQRYHEYFQLFIFFDDGGYQLHEIFRCRSSRNTVH